VLSAETWTPSVPTANVPTVSGSVVHVDTEHGYTHFDRLYRRDQSRDPIDVDFWAAWAHMEANWRTHAQSYEREFG